MLPVLWRASARTALARIIHYIAKDNPAAARRLKDMVEASVLPLAQHPYLYRSGRVSGTREIVVHPQLHPGLRCTGRADRGTTSPSRAPAVSRITILFSKPMYRKIVRGVDRRCVAGGALGTVLGIAYLLAGLTALSLVSALSGCANWPTSQQTLSEPAQTSAPNNWAAASAAPAANQPTRRAKGWHHYEFPGKRATQYEFTRKDLRSVVAVNAVSSASLLRQNVRIEPAQLAHIKFSWQVPELIANADLADRDLADSPVRIVLAFEGDRSKFSVKNAMLSELSRALTGEPMPYATLMYVWCNTRAPGSVITSPRTDRIRKMVVESGAKNLNQWLDYDRDIRADFETAFGEAPGALIAIGIMTDSDNTKSTTRAWYGPVKLAGP